MAIEEKDANVADPSAAKEDEYDDDGNLIDPSQAGKPDAGKEAEPKEPLMFEGRPVAEIYAENKRKAEEMAIIKTQNEKLLDTIHDGFSQPAEPAAAAPLGAISPDLYEGDDALFTKEQAEAIRQLNIQAIQDYDNRVVAPNEVKVLDRADRADVNFIVADDATLKPYRSEILDVLKKMPLEQRADAEAPFRAAEQVKGNHVNDIIKEAKTEALKEAKKNRKIISENPSGSTVITEAGTFQLTPDEQALCNRTGVSPEKYLASKQRYLARKSVEVKVG